MNLLLASHHTLVSLPDYNAKLVSTGSQVVTLLLMLPKMLGAKALAGQIKPYRTDPLPVVRLDPLGELEMLGHLELPNGTVTLNLDRARGIMDVFTEHEPHPSDWAIAAFIIGLLCDTGSMGEPCFLQGIDTWRIQLRPSALLSC